MAHQDIRIDTLSDAITDLGDQFATKDVSEHPKMATAHPHLLPETHYHVWVGRAISASRALLGVEEIKKGTGRGSVWRKQSALQGRESGATPAGTAAGTEAGVRPRASTGSTIVRPGHYATLDYMATPAFREVKALFESEPEIGGVYFRPIANKLTVVDLSAKSPKPRVGVGSDPYVPIGATATTLRPTMANRLAHLRDVRRRQTKVYEENRIEAGLIRDAQQNALCLPGFPDRLRFINSQWRLDLWGSQKFADLIAVDLPTRRLVIIELKREADDASFEQVADYVDWFELHADEVRPFFLRLARVMGELYGCPELARLDGLRSSCVGLVAWPGWFGRLKVHGLELLGHTQSLENDDPVDPGGQIDENADMDMDMDDDMDNDDLFRVSVQPWELASCETTQAGGSTGSADHDQREM